MTEPPDTSHASDLPEPPDAPDPTESSTEPGSTGSATTSVDETSTRHPGHLEVERQRAADLQLRIADKITAFAGSMNFVYLHAVVFALWMLLVEVDPWPKLTLVVSLEAIFLSTFVMIGQNRQSAYQQAKADHDFVAQELELKTNTELTREIHRLTVELHRRVVEPTSPDAAG